MQSFHVLIRPRPAAAQAGPVLSIAGVNCETLVVSPDSAALFDVSFETVCERLARLPRMFIEPDGSFVWTGVAADGQRWQLDGNLFDRADRLCYVDCKGQAPTDALDALLACLGWPKEPVLFEYVAAGVLLSESAFRQLTS
jgi:hypothetical protein